MIIGSIAETQPERQLELFLGIDEVIWSPFSP